METSQVLLILGLFLLGAASVVGAGIAWNGVWLLGTLPLVSFVTLNWWLTRSRRP